MRTLVMSQNSIRAVDKSVRRVLPALVLAFMAAPALARGAADDHFDEVIRPILEDNCYTCHAFGVNKGNVDLEALADADDWTQPDARATWLAVLKNVQAEIMPPSDHPQPSDEERELLLDWITFDAFALDPEHPDPGRVTVRRLNRTEYRNTIRDLMGVDFNTEAEFPADDTGHGFDTIADVLTISPLLMERYIAAAQDIVGRAVPTTSGTVPERSISGRRFRPVGEGRSNRPSSGPERRFGGFVRVEGPLSLSYYEPAEVATTIEVEHDGTYQVVLNLSATERYVEDQFDSNRCLFVVSVDGEEQLRREFSRQSSQSYRFPIDLDWTAGNHEMTLTVEPLTPEAEQVRSLTLRIDSLTVLGPFEDEHLVRPPNYERFFPGTVPDDPEALRQYTRELLSRFATRAFRRPVGDETADRLTDLALVIAAEPGRTFEAGVSQAMVAVLASPRFLFREEGIEPGDPGPHPLIDEYALASRLSYLLWSTMPDDELFALADRGELRANLGAQVERMLADERSNQFVRNFVGQWLQVRNIDSIPVNAFAVLSRDEPPDPEAEARRERFRELRRKPFEELTDAEKAELDEVRDQFRRAGDRFRQFEMDRGLRIAMRRETELLFETILREDRSLIELLDSDYTFLNERLARQYGIEGIEGDEMRRVDLPPDSPRGGILTQGTILAVTSNPDRTSPVKRGLFILENILGTPPAPPPPNIPSLEEAGKDLGGRVPSVREAMELHRSDPLCNSCHNRMDPLGLALENFNALGMYREVERTGPIDSSGVLITGEPFQSVQELKRILAEDRRQDFYRCLVEKMLTYALGRGLEYHDVQTIDALVNRLNANDGRASELILGIIESAPFQRRRGPAGQTTANATTSDPDDRILGTD
ncbi:DUF1592 domain-containing protein [Tautonia rosea]|uniref:DUF1592 domain-containing protein n=1 Tax=Tautonia rosea TaxID=2728037 RepID=UPI001474EC20|nr:DUF1592 domain-containing protein [Tautonia rosea]